MSALYPLRFREVIRDYGFGGRWIPEVFPAKRLPDTGIIAETWEVSDLPGRPGTVVNGEFAGMSFRDLISREAEAILGAGLVQRFGPRFPLLIKFLDVTHTLGEQVHPGDADAPRLGKGDTGKTEAWYMLFVKDGATIRCGNRDGVTARDVGNAVRTGRAPECMPEHVVRPGDAFLLYAGTMHYSAGGILLYEIMQNSDAGWSLRQPRPDAPEDARERHIRAAEEIVHLESRADFRTVPVVLNEGPARHTMLMACTHFALERLELTEPLRLSLDGRFFVLTQIEGVAHVRSGPYQETLAAGNSCLLPAALQEAELVPEGNAVLLKAYVPDLGRDIVMPLRERGISDDRIALLGARTELNPLRRVLANTPRRGKRG